LVDVSGLDHAGSVSVHEREGSPYHVFSSLGQLVAEAAEELFQAHLAVAVNVVVLDQRLQLDLLEEQSESVESLLELLWVQLAVSVSVVPLEDDFQVSDASAWFVLDLHLDLKQQFFDFNF
jgi:hypothetical protein